MDILFANSVKELYKYLELEEINHFDDQRHLSTCLLCQEQYVGESSRTLHDRLSEHLRFATPPDNNNYKDEALAVHYRQYHHGQIPELSFKSLNSEPNTVSRKIIEAMHIQQLKPQLNDKDECITINRFLVKN